ncbi:MAG TPA: hypothetical protein VGQ09_05055 [Chitinophagaceae bacterium]|jgi:hypothetical protein|nr:hypothetical protein [Chitinophagaceae bacterium]
MKNPFTVLIGEQLSSVIFVQDYLQLDFDGKKMTCYEWPTVKLVNGNLDINNKDYRNALCSLIASKVSDAILIDNEKLDINFESGEQIGFSLKEASGEVIYFSTPEGEWSSI